MGHPTYNNYRSEIATLFPGLANSNGAVGFLSINTLSLSNGLHTIVWTATDSDGNTEGLGSRYFTVSNRSAVTRSAAAATAAAPAITAATLAALPVDTSGVTGRRSWDPDRPWREYPANDDGIVVMRGEELDRLELQLADPGSGRYTGSLRIGDRLAPLPVGAQIDGAGHFTWAPGVGFVGSYDLVFVRWSGAQPVARTEVRVILQPKQLGEVGPRVLIDTPVALAEVDAGFTIEGWAADCSPAPAAASQPCTSGPIRWTVARRCSSASPRTGSRAPTWPRRSATSSSPPGTASRFTASRPGATISRCLAGARSAAGSLRQPSYASPVR